MPYRDEAGQVAGVITIAGDVTEMLEFEKRLGQLRLLLDTLDDAMVFTDHQLAVESWSQSAKDMYGWDDAEAVGRNLFELLGTRPVGTGIPAMLESLERDGRVEFEAVERRKDGSAVSTVCRVVALRDDSGELTGYAAINRDSSDLTDAEAAAEESEDKFARAFTASPLMLTITRLRDGRFIDANDTFLKAMGFAREEVIGRTPIEIGALKPEDRATILTSLRAERPLRGILLPVRTKSGQQRLMEYSADIFELGGEDVIISMANDVTVRKNYEDALRTVNKKLNLLGSVTRHDALNQLGIIKGWLSATMEATDDTSVRDLVSRADSAADALRSHLEFTAQYKSLGMKRPEWVRVGEVASRVARELVGEDVEVVVSLEGVELYADPMLENVFRNLFTNSVIHGGEVTRISLSYGLRGDDMTIVYEDDGVGISEKDRRWIFQRGYGKNTGYGLYLSSEILSITGMTITETGTQGKGTRFEITVPPTRHRVAG